VGAFASDVAHLSRIVTLNNMTIAPRPDGTLMLDATAKTYRYLDKDEVAAQQKATTGGKKK
jgi:type IV pilus assembly protein PilO